MYIYNIFHGIHRPTGKLEKCSDFRLQREIVLMLMPKICSNLLTTKDLTVENIL